MLHVSMDTGCGGGYVCRGSWIRVWALFIDIAVASIGLWVVQDRWNDERFAIETNG